MLDRFVRDHRSHAAPRAALQWIAAWLDNAAAGQRVPGGVDLQHVAAAGITPWQILIRVSALWMFSAWNARHLDDGLALTVQLGHHLLSLAPRERLRDAIPGVRETPVYRRLSLRVRREVGEHVRTYLVPFFVNLRKALEAVWDAKQQLRKDIGKGFG